LALIAGRTRAATILPVLTADFADQTALASQGEAAASNAVDKTKKYPTEEADRCATRGCAPDPPRNLIESPVIHRCNLPA
jgi:hypothetical protein